MNSLSGIINSLEQSAVLDSLAIHILIMIGSNAPDASVNLNWAMHILSQFGTITQLNSHVSADYTGKSNEQYFNIALILTPFKPFLIKTLYHTLKTMEKTCGRIDNHPTIALDLDMIAVYLDNWYMIKERLPLKEHEKICIGLTSPLHSPL